MNSTNVSEPPVVEISDLKIEYMLDIHQPVTMKEAFVKIAQSPLRALQRQQHRHVVIQGLSLNIQRGERVGLLGVNGCGKTSLCRAISGTYQPRVGQVTTRGLIHAVYDTTLGVLPELTGRENAEMMFELLFPYVGPEEKEHLLQDALEFSELGRFLDVPFQSYSKGMQARLCLSIISAKGSDILILDEVFDGADQFFKERVSARVVKMIEESGAVIFVTHSPDQLKLVCNRAVVLKAGNVYFDGNVEDALAVYDNLHGSEN